MHLTLQHCFEFLLGRLQFSGEMKSKGFAIIFFGGGGGEAGGIMADVQVANCTTQLYIYITTDSVTSIRPLIQYSQSSLNNTIAHVRYIKILT